MIDTGDISAGTVVKGTATGTFAAGLGYGTGVVATKFLFPTKGVSNSLGWPVTGGAGPISGTIGVAPSTGSIKALQNYAPGKGVEFIFDPEKSIFVVGNGIKHSPLASSIGADTSKVVGGIFSRGEKGVIITNEQSGHFWKNWTPGVRQQYTDFMRSKGLDVQHYQ